MPRSAPKPCGVCGVLVGDGTARCLAHQLRLGTFADSRRGSRQSRGYGAAWERLRERIMVRDQGLCQPCLSDGKVTVAAAVDHVINKARWRRTHGTLDGVDDEANLQAICTPCHDLKSAREGAIGRGGGQKSRGVR